MFDKNKEVPGWKMPKSVCCCEECLIMKRGKDLDHI